jgi:hypothetical protein
MFLPLSHEYITIGTYYRQEKSYLTVYYFRYTVRAWLRKRLRSTDTLASVVNTSGYRATLRTSRACVRAASRRIGTARVRRRRRGKKEVAGIEPTHGLLRSACLTTWLHPRIKPIGNKGSRAKACKAGSTLFTTFSVLKSALDSIAQNGDNARRNTLLRVSLIKSPRRVTKPEVLRSLLASLF